MSDKGYRARCLTDRYLLLHVPDSNMHTAEERTLVSAYRQKHQELIALESKAQTLRAKDKKTGLGFFENIKYKRLEEKIRACQNALTASEADPHLQGLIERERARSLQKIAEQQSKLIEDIHQRKIQEKRAQLSAHQAAQIESAQEIRKSILLAMNACEYPLTSIGKLALATMMPVTKMRHSNKKSYVCKTNLASRDTVIYSAFLVRTMALSQASNDVLANHFTEEFFNHITLALDKLFPIHDVDMKAMFNSRMMFYERTFAKKHGMHNGIQAAAKKFELILKADALHNRYVEFGERSPLPLVGIDANQKCRSDVAQYQTVLLETIKKDLEAVLENLKQ